MNKSKTERIAEPEGLCEHFEAMMWMNALIINLKQKLLNFDQSEAITMERLDEWDKHYKDLERCRRPWKVK